MTEVYGDTEALDDQVTLMSTGAFEVSSQVMPEEIEKIVAIAWCPPKETVSGAPRGAVNTRVDPLLQSIRPIRLCWLAVADL